MPKQNSTALDIRHIKLGIKSAVFTHKIAVVLPCYRVRQQILDVIQRIDSDVSAIYVVDDCCPEQSGAYVQRMTTDPRVRVVINPVNMGVGGAVIAGYRAALQDGMDIVVKIDGDGQMAPELMKLFVRPIVEGLADYTKGNRFFNVENVRTMPGVRLFGNAVLSFMSKLSTGYWNLFDPTNGYTAIHAKILSALPLNQISCRYFFETDMLFRLNTLGATVTDIPMDSVYGKEISSLEIGRILGPFLLGHLRNTGKRIFYNYFLRDFSIASVELLAGTALLAFGGIFGINAWLDSIHSGQLASSGTVMLATLPVILGIQLLLSFLSFDIRQIPQTALHLHIQ